MGHETIRVEEFKRKIIQGENGTVEVIEDGRTTSVIEPTAAPKKKEFRPKPKPEPASDYPPGAINSIFPLLQEVYQELNVEREEGFWLDKLALKHLSDEEAFEALIEAKKTPKQVADALLGLDTAYQKQKGFTPQDESLAALRSRVVDWLSEEYEKVSSQ